MDIERTIKSIIRDNLDFPVTLEKMDGNSALSELGVNSITFVKIIICIENELGIAFEDEFLDINKLDTLAKFVDYVAAKCEARVLLGKEAEGGRSLES